MPQISVIVPVYKVESYLHRCVDSILAQTFKGFELILVDDGSPDSCGKICDEYAKKDGRIHVIHKQNGGLSDARNAGIDWAFERSDSEWLAFVDSDDWVHPQYLELLYKAACDHAAPVGACRFVRVDSQTDFPKLSYMSYVSSWDEYYMKDDVNGAVAWNKLYKKELFNGLRYPVGKLHEDEWLTYKVLHRALNIAVLPLEMYYYYYNPAGITKSSFSLKRLDCIDAFREQRSYAKQIGNTEFYQNRAKKYIEQLAYTIKGIEDSKVISDDDKRYHIRVLRRELRTCINKYGTAKLPFGKNKWIYIAAYPALSVLAKAVRKVRKNG